MDFSSLSPASRTLAIQRLTALWALNECGLGGILHALNSPFTGLLVGGLAMVCISLICTFAENKWRAVMTSLIIVLLIKGMVSPHSSPTAYVAVSFQAVTGALIYRSIPMMLPASLLFFTLGHLESAMQRLIMLTLLYGNSLWEAINLWGDAVLRKWSVILPFSSSQLVIYAYLILHFVAGLCMGWMMWRLIRSIRLHWGEARFRVFITHLPEWKMEAQEKKRSRKWKHLLFFVIVLSMILLAYLITPESRDGWKTGLYVLLRVSAIVLIWFLLIGPWLVKLVQRFLQKKYQHLSTAVEQTMDMFPQMIFILQLVRKETMQQRGWNRLRSFIVLSILYLLQYQMPDDTHPDRTDTQL